jgi:5'-3' exonuclease
VKTRTLLVDGSYLLKRSFSGAKDTYTDSYGHIGGLYSFMTTLRMLIRDYRANKVILAWDGENGGIQRHVIDPAYKANRKNKKWYVKIELSDAEIKREEYKEQSLLKQRKRIQSYAEDLFIRQIEVEGIEADDLIAAYVIEKSNDEDITLYTNDRDFLQLLEYDITIKFGNIQNPINKTNFFFEFDYHYKNALSIKIIEGDTSDNLAGIAGIKETTLLKHFPEMKFKQFTVREICKKADEINKERVKNKKKPLKAFENLLSNIERLKINHRLMNLSEPFLNEEAEEELAQMEMPLSDEDRNSKNLLIMMNEDQFLSVYGGTFVNYIEPFYPVIMNEKQNYKNYLKIKRKLI